MRLGWLVLAMGGCSETNPDKLEPGPGATTDTDVTVEDTDTDTVGDTDTDPTVDTDVVTTTVSEWDCEALPTKPQSVMEIDILTEEDFDFDLDGYLLYQGGQDLVGRNQYGSFIVVSPDISSDASGIQVLANGDVAVAAPDTGNLKYVDRLTGANRVLIGGLATPNGLESGEGNIVYFTELNGGRVRWIDTTDESTGVIAEGLSTPNGLAFGPGEATLYVATDGDPFHMVLAIDRVGDGWGVPRVVATMDAQFDGVETDVCGNLYLVDYFDGRLVRVNPTTGEETNIANIKGNGSYSSLRWGNGVGNWSNTTLYVTNRNKIYAIEAGVPGNPDPRDPP